MPAHLEESDVSVFFLQFVVMISLDVPVVSVYQRVLDVMDHLSVLISLMKSTVQVS